MKDLRDLQIEVLEALERLHRYETGIEYPDSDAGYDYVALYLRSIKIREQCGYTLGECGWIMLLDLYKHLPRTIQVSSVCIGSMHPPTTALRHITELVRHGLVERQRDPVDARRVFLVLTEEGKKCVERWIRMVSRADGRVATAIREFRTFS